MNSASKDGAALHSAIETDQFHAAKALLGANPSCVDEKKNGRTPLHSAAKRGHGDLAALLLEHGAAVNHATQSRNASPLMIAASWGHTSVLARLIEFGADVNQTANRRWNNNTALHLAATLENSASLHLLLLRGSAVNPVDSEGETPLDVAIKSSRSANTTILVEFGGMSRMRPRLNAPSCPLHGIRSKILDLQMKDFVDGSGQARLDTAIIWATARGSVRLLEYLLEIDKGLADVCDEDGWVPLHHAAWKGDMGMARALLSKAASANVCTTTRFCTPLHLAAQRGHGSTVSLLLDSGAEPGLQTRHGSTARMLGVRSEHWHVVRILDEHAIANRRGQRGFQHEHGSDHRPAAAQAKRSERMVSNRGYRLHEGDEHDSSDEQPEGDGHDGRLFGISPEFMERKTFTLLITTFKHWCQLGEAGVPVKVAVIDTGLDLNNDDLGKRRVEAFFRNAQGDLEARLAEENEPDQMSRVKGRINFARNIQTGEADVQDLDGHGTRIAGIILRLAPTSELYIARVCDGNVRNGSHRVENRVERSPTQDNVKKAIDWAIDQRVDIINLSLGFSTPGKRLKEAVCRAREAGIIIFASMSNDGMYLGYEEWPASDFSVAIGISSCKQGGTHPSEFSPRPIQGNPNFIVAGEGIIVHKLSHSYRSEADVQNRFNVAAGSSYATAVATSMGALIIGFMRQSSRRNISSKTRREALKNLKDHTCMAMLLKEVGRTTMGYHWISPELLWTGFKPSPTTKRIADSARSWAWDVIQEAIAKWKKQTGEGE